MTGSNILKKNRHSLQIGPFWPLPTPFPLTYKKDRKVNRIPFNNLIAKVRHTVLRGVPVLQTKNQEHTAEMLVDLARDCWRLRGEIFADNGENILGAGATGLKLAQIEEIVNQNPDNPISKQILTILQDRSEPSANEVADSRMAPEPAQMTAEQISGGEDQVSRFQPDYPGGGAALRWRTLGEYRPLSSSARRRLAPGW